jgi:hypothetical protein
LTAEKRTLRAMQAVVAGVPLVSSAWITSCGESNQVVLPDSSMFVRTLPTKSARDDQIMDFGVSAVAAAIRSSGLQLATLHFKVLNDVSVCLCGHFKAAILELLQKAGAEVLTAPETVAKLSADGDTKVVLLCSDDDCDYCEIFVSIKSQGRIDESQVLVVNANWLFDSISCGSVLTAGCYEPKGKQAKELWALTMDTN